MFDQKEYFPKRKSLMKIISYTELKDPQDELQHSSKAAVFYRKFISVNVYNSPSIDNF